MSSQNYHVLLLEDNESDALMIQRVLRDLDGEFQLSHVTSIQEATEVVARAAHNFSFIVSDYNLPDGNGIDLFLDLKSKNIDIPFLLLTGVGSEELVVKAMRLGVADYVIKSHYSEFKDIFSMTIQRQLDILAYKQAREDAQHQLRNSEKKYKVLAEEFEEANSIKELLLDVIIHDLKNPAGVINNVAAMLLDENPESELAQLLNSSSEDMIRLMEHSTIMAKVAIGDKIAQEEISAFKMISKVVQEFDWQIKQTGMVVHINIPKDMVLHANPIIAEIFKNYVSNALKYASEGGEVSMYSKEIENSVIFCVEDKGTTIPEHERKNIFIRRLQLHKEERKGSGLGLAIVKRIAKVENGEVWVEPNEPTGNRFCFKMSLPAHAIESSR